jgi:hypothetical protein
MVEPPSTAIAAPWMWRAGSLHRKRVSAAMSSGSPSRRRPYFSVDSQHRPEHTACADATEQLERKAVDPGLVRQVDEPASLCRARRVDQDVAAVEPSLHLVVKRLHTVEPAQVARDEQRRRSGCRNQLVCDGETARRGRGEHGLGPFPGERDGDRAADSAARARDDRHLSLEMTRQYPPFIVDPLTPLCRLLPASSAARGLPTRPRLDDPRIAPLRPRPCGGLRRCRSCC